MKTVLIVEDSKFFGMTIKNKIETETSFNVVWVQSRTEAVSVLSEAGEDFFAGILDFNLPDAPKGEIIDEVIKRDIPAIVFTGSVSEEIRGSVWSKKVVDYVIKDAPKSLDYIINMLNRIEKNADTKVLIVDDVAFYRKALSNLLIIHRYQVFNASNGKEALDIIEEHPDMKLVITDFNMPEMDGYMLTQKIREKYSRDDLAVIGISSEGENVLAARFLKIGANDFITKQTFLTEEFYCRVTQNIENLERIHLIREASIKDALTDLYNRRYFFETGNKLFANAIRENLTITCGMIDIDHFKDVNDTYGHEAGDKTLVHISSILNHRMRDTDIVARLGGEEFCVLAINMRKEYAKKVFEELRKKVEESSIEIEDDTKIHITVSMGVATELAGSLEDMVKKADKLLYEAKESGRNRVITSG